MNQTITRTLRKFASILRKEFSDGKNIKDLRKIKDDMMNSIYKNVSNRKRMNELLLI